YLWPIPQDLGTVAWRVDAYRGVLYLHRGLTGSELVVFENPTKIMSSQILGFRYYSTRDLRSPGVMDESYGVPIAYGLAASCVLPLIWLWRLHLALARRRRLRDGQCPACGYDLRGSPAGGACPECGAEREAAR